MSIDNRPLSPHISIYKPQITSVLSIFHRISGFFLYIGFIALSWLIICQNYNQEKIILANIFSSLVFQIILFLWSVAFIYHCLNGIRHLVWDSGSGYNKKSVVRSGVLVTLLSSICSLLIFYLMFWR